MLQDWQRRIGSDLEGGWKQTMRVQDWEDVGTNNRFCYGWDESGARVQDECGKPGPKNPIKGSVARARDGEVACDVATLRLLYTISDLRLRLSRGGTFQDVERK